MRIKTDAVCSIEDPVLVHVIDQTKDSAKGKDVEAEVVKKVEIVDEDKDETDDTLKFESREFSPYVIVELETITAHVITASGETYEITVSYGPDAGIPDAAELAVTEILPSDDAFDGYVEKVNGELGDSAGYIRLFDISIMRDGQKVHPADTVDVEIALADADMLTDDVQAVHFASDDELEVLEATLQGETVSFSADSFSVYAIVDAPEPVPSSGWKKAATIQQVAKLGSAGFYVRHPNGYYFTSEQVDISSSRTGIKKTVAASSPDDAAGAVLYYFEQVGNVSDTSGQFKVYCKSEGGQKQYVKQSSSSLSFTTEDDATVFTIDPFPDAANTFRVVGSGGYYWNMRGGNGGGEFAAWNNATDTNARMQFEFYESPEDDPYKLDGKPFGIAYHDNSVTSAALTAEGKTVSSQQRLVGLDMVMKPDVTDNDGILLVAQDSDIQMWTFESLGGDKYHLTTTVDGQKKYLTISGANVILQDEPDATNSVVKATPGTDSNAGKWHFTVGTRSLNFTGSAANGFNGATGNGATTWMNLVEKSVLDDDDFTTYTAHKVSVSDTENVPDGARIIIYTRVWNDTTKRYEFYAVDHNGSLIRCYDTGDGIEWVGSKVNTALWDFTEYHNSDGSPNYYYELQNDQYDNYIAPQMTDEQVMSENTIGINLNGRRLGQSYTTIIAWDDPNYTYAGLKVENGRLVARSLSESDYFYFAIMKDNEGSGALSEVATIDSDAYGIEMKMIDYNNEKIGTVDSPRDTAQVAYFGGDNDNPGLLSTNLGEDGYPVSTGITPEEGVSLSELYNGAIPVNNLFLQSIYTESGYFEYDSTSNFAHLNVNGGTGSFTVYDQLGAIGNYNALTNYHGQFMPYDTLYEVDEAGNPILDDEGNPVPRPYCSFTNQTSVTGAELPDTDARKGENLYNIGKRSEVDYHFGMEISASFTQTADGKDAWGHDIVFEFSGDDDFWLYVDGELVLDLGGVHSAMVGSVNFRTGEVTSKRNGEGMSTLYDIFKSHYVDRGMPEAEINAKLDELFEQKTVDGNSVYVFKDYSKHDMKIFYMERGAGASNLHMRFNLAAVQPGTFILSKKLSGTDNASNDLIEFPYQVWYLSGEDHEWHRLGKEYADEGYVTYKDTITSVPFKERFTPAGGTDSYDDVFMLKPGQSAQVKLPEDALEYYVVECGVNPDVYDQVTINGEVTSGDPTNNKVGETPREDYRSSEASLEERSEVDFDNHVAPGAMRTLTMTKRLYDVDGETLLSYPDEDDTLFSLRLYLGNESADPDNLPGANLYSYYVKGPDGCYCKWSADDQRFVSLNIADYATLSAYLDGLSGAERDAIIFATSPNGSISKIPAGYSVEIRDLIVGTQYKVEERDYEIPKGYTLRQTDGYTRVDVDPEDRKSTPYYDTIKTEAEETAPEIEVRNQKGWGLTVQKVWTDKDFMELHDPIYFAIYIRQGEGESATETLLESENGIRQLKTDEDEAYFFFDDLQSGTPFANYVVREVTIDGDFTVKEDGRVILGDGASVTPILEGDTLEIGGQPVHGEYSGNGFVYTVAYEVGRDTGHNHNVRTDTVTNSRPGIKLFKTDWAGEALADAVFTLKDSYGNNVAAETYTSRSSDGLITIVYVSPGTYKLEEIATPRGYVVLDSPMSITVRDDGQVEVAGVGEAFYTLAQASDDEMASITIKDRTSELVVKKTDGSADATPLEGVHFALYQQVIDVDGKPRKDYFPIEGYEDLVTGKDGVLPQVTLENLKAGTYYLTETSTLDGYVLLADDLCFTIGADGRISIESGGEAGWLVQSDNGQGHVTYVLSIPNHFGSVLPIVGGPGTFLLYLAGSIMIVGAVAFIGRRWLAKFMRDARES
ncbi:MAG: fibro-slime domain-containing protein [Eggerthellaceae bacterium]|nr:fibro-slime domain-containing protein [Eggerthellaceae bacterium]